MQTKHAGDGLSDANHTDGLLSTYFAPGSVQRKRTLHKTAGGNYFFLHSLEGKLETQFPPRVGQVTFPKLTECFECRGADPKPTVSRKKVPFSDACSWDKIFICLFSKGQFYNSMSDMVRRGFLSCEDGASLVRVCGP